MGRPVDRSQVLLWREGWSFTDKLKIEHALDVLPEVDYYVPNSEAYVGARVDGRMATCIAPGYIWWPQEIWIDALDRSLIGEIEGNASDGWWHCLSTFRHRSTGERALLEELRAPCPRCFTVPTVTDACFCD